MEDSTRDIMDNAKETVETAIEQHIKSSIERMPEIKALSEGITADTNRFNEILDTLDETDRDFVNSYLSKQSELRKEQIGYLYIQGFNDAYVSLKNKST